MPIPLRDPAEPMTQHAIDQRRDIRELRDQRDSDRERHGGIPIRRAPPIPTIARRLLRRIAIKRFFEARAVAQAATPHATIPWQSIDEDTPQQTYPVTYTHMMAHMRDRRDYPRYVLHYAGGAWRCERQDGRG